MTPWPCDDYEAPLTCFTTPDPKTLTCEGCRAAFPSGPEVRTHYPADPVAVEGVETVETLAEVLAVAICYEVHRGSGTPIEALSACPNCTSRAKDVWLPRIVQARAGEGALRERIEAVLDTTEWYCDDDHDWPGRRRLEDRLRRAALDPEVTT